MATIAVNPLVLKDVVLSLGTDNYQSSVEQVAFTPSASSITWTGLALNTHTDVSTATWTCALTYVQDWETEDSLSRFLFDNEGSEIAATFTPRTGSGPSFTADLIITPGSIGGNVNAYAKATVTLGVKAKPVLVPAGA